MHINEKVLYIAKKVKCVTCEGQTVDASDSLSAKDMMAFIKEKLQAGWSEQEILGFLHQTYDATPVESTFTLAAMLYWAIPVGVGAILSLYFVFKYIRRT